MVEARRLATLAVLLGSGLVAACGDGAVPQVRDEPAVVVPVRTARVEETNAPIVVRVSGVLSAKEDQRLSFKIGGVLDDVRVDEGAEVRAGQVLAVLKLSEIDAQVRAAENGVAKAERDVERVKKLETASVATLQQRQDAETGLEVAKSQLEIARFNRQFATIVAPASGVIARRLASAGELVGPGMPVFVLLATGKGWVVRAAVPDRDFVRLRLGDAATLSVDALPGRTLTARVAELASAPHPMTGTYDVELRVEGRVEGLVSGLFARGEITPSERTRLSWVPAESVLEADGRHAYVWAIGADHTSLKKVKIRTARFDRGRIGVDEGLEGVREVVTAGAPYLGEKVAFRVVGESTPHAAR
ncbi:efflux RND transporter periplasmic adaptor subunit [Myxococcota bacterium]|nr:efflux RND transporter periplasmic adaptor subunit [Myxococcota bacterium]